MRISDWSSDVCSSDLNDALLAAPFSRQPIVYLADGAARLANEFRLMRQACARKPIAPATFPPANSKLSEKASSRLSSDNAGEEWCTRSDSNARPSDSDRKSTRLNSSH